MEEGEDVAEQSAEVFWSHSGADRRSFVVLDHSPLLSAHSTPYFPLRSSGGMGPSSGFLSFTYQSIQSARRW